MAKSKHFTGQPIFNQLLGLIPSSLVHSLSRKYQTNRYCKKFRTYDHLVTMLYSCFHRCSSLREVITGMQATSQRLSHLGLSSTPRRSTLADANERRSADFFQDLYHGIYQRHYSALPDSLQGKRLLDKLFIVDSTIITLFSQVLQSTGCFGVNGKKKGGIKAHVLMRAQDNIPCFVRLSEGKQSDTRFLSTLKFPQGSLVVMDKGYRNYQQFLQWSHQKVSYVTRLHERFVYKVLNALPLSNTQITHGIEQDTVIELGNPKTAFRNPVQKARLILYYDSANKRHFQFLTNNFTYSALTIAAIYKKRWQIELLFKRIKQNFQLHYFLGDSENAIRIQLWCTLIADLLLKIVKDKIDKKRKWSMANLSALVRLHLGTYIHLLFFLLHPEKALLHYEDPYDKGQLSLFAHPIRGA